MDALDLQEAGATAILLEAIPEVCSKMIQANVDIPIFGIGAGSGLYGQLLISNDALGLYPNFKPKFAKNFFNEVIKHKVNNSSIYNAIDLFTESLELYKAEVVDGTFPSDEFSYPILDIDVQALKKSSFWK